MLDMIAELSAVPPMVYDVNAPRSWWFPWRSRERGGWLTVTHDKEGTTSVMWTSEKDSHQPFDGPALSVTINPSGELICYMESALSMWVKWGYGRGGDAELRRAVHFIRWAHIRLCSASNAK